MLFYKCSIWAKLHQSNSFTFPETTCKEVAVQHVVNNMREISQEQITCEYIWTKSFLDDAILMFANTLDMNHSLPTQIIIWWFATSNF